MSFIRHIHLFPCRMTRRIIRCLDQIWIPFNGNNHWHGQLVRRIVQPHVRSSDPEAWIRTKKTGSLVHHPTINPPCNSLASDNPIPKGIFIPWKTCSLGNTTSENLTYIPVGSDNPGALKCLSDPSVVGLSEPTEKPLFLFSNLELNWTSILSASKCFSEFLCRSWVDLEQVWKNSKANSWMINLLT